jgi:uncharacterized protein with HEPN domain
MKDDKVYLQHILECIEKIETFSKDISSYEFNQNILLQDAIIRNIEIIGEATKRVSAAFKEVHPEIPWKQMAGMRDKLVHDYLDIEPEIIWITINADIPLLKELISKLLLTSN